MATTNKAKKSATPSIFYSRMLGSVPLSENGDSEERIGLDNKRTQNDFIIEGQELVYANPPLPVTCDIRPIHPPYFGEYSFTDLMGGVIVGTLSAEINNQMRKEASEIDCGKEFPINEVFDKYELSSKVENTHKKVIFMPGSNTTEYMDQSVLATLIMDEEWVVKPHPVSGDGFISELIHMFGGHRILDKKLSGHKLLKEAEEIATSAASEMFLMARLLDKPVTNMTNLARQHLLSYGTFVNQLDGTPDDKRKINNMLMGTTSGFLLASNGTKRNKEILEAYYARTMEKRAVYKPTIPQRLMVNEIIPKHWETANRSPRAKQAPAPVVPTSKVPVDAVSKTPKQ